MWIAGSLILFFMLQLQVRSPLRGALLTDLCASIWRISISPVVSRSWEAYAAQCASVCSTLDPVECHLEDICVFSLCYSRLMSLVPYSFFFLTSVLSQARCSLQIFLFLLYFGFRGPNCNLNTVPCFIFHSVKSETQALIILHLSLTQLVPPQGLAFTTCS